MRNAVFLGGRECNREVARTVRGDAARLGEAHEGALGDALEVAGINRSVGGDDHHDRAVGAFDFLLPRIAAELFAHGDAVNIEEAAKVGLNEDADRVAAHARGQLAGRRADAALEAEGLRAGACAHDAFFNGTGLGRLDGLQDVLGGEEAGADVVDAAVVRFTDHAVDAAAVAVFLEGERIVDDAVKACGHVEGIDEDDRRLDVAEFLHLRIARHLAEAVREEDARRNLFLEEVAAVRKNRGHARMSALLVVMHVHLTDEHAFNVSDGVVLARLQDAELDAVFARTQRVFLGAHRTYHHRTGHGGGHQSLHEIHFFSSFQTGWSCRLK